MECNTGCTHLQHLEPRPQLDELPALRKGLRKRKLPEFPEGFFGNHKTLGSFNLTGRGEKAVCEWQLPGQEARKAALIDLSLNVELEAARLELGWLIANMYQLDGLHNRDGIPDPHEAMRAMAFYDRHVNAWRHWALVPAGYLNLKT